MGGGREREREMEPSAVLSNKDTNSVDQGPTLMTSLNLNYLLLDSVFKFNTLGVRASTYEFWGDTSLRSMAHSKDCPLR